MYNKPSGARRKRPSFQSGGRSSAPRPNRAKRFKKYIDPSKFVKQATPIAEQTYESINVFTDFDLHQTIHDALRSREFSAPSKIQDLSIPFALEGRDVVGIANTGTGKTAAFLLPTIHKLSQNKQQTALILAPTRELAEQIREEARLFNKGLQMRDTLLIGGSSMGKQLQELQRRPQLIIGTPGRIKDHLERGSLKLDTTQTVVLDEVDRMLDMGFLTDIRHILSKVPADRQSLFYSATLNDQIKGLLSSFTNDPEIIMARTAETSDNVNQSVSYYQEETERLEHLHNLLATDSASRVLIFCETKRGTERLSKDLAAKGFKTDAIHGNKSQGQRQRALKRFRDGQALVLVATDVAARGLDVDDVSHVINYDLPETYEDYTHRIGRTGRGGQIGTAITYVQSYKHQ